MNYSDSTSLDLSTDSSSRLWTFYSIDIEQLRLYSNHLFLSSGGGPTGPNVVCQSVLQSVAMSKIAVRLRRTAYSAYICILYCVSSFRILPNIAYMSDCGSKYVAEQQCTALSSEFASCIFNILFMGSNIKILQFKWKICLELRVLPK